MGIGQREGGARGRARVLVIDLAPDLAEALGRTFPGAEIRIASQADPLDRLLLDSWDVLVVDLDTIRLGQVLPHVDRLSVVGITSSAVRARDHGELADVLLRPVLGEDLRRSVGRLLGHAGPDSPADRRLTGIRTGLPVAKLLALGAGLAIDLVTTGGPSMVTLLAAVALVVCVARLRPRDGARGRAWTAADLSVGCALLAPSGGPESSYLLFALVIAADAGLRFPLRGVATSVVTLLLALVPGGVAMLGQAGGRQTWTAVAVVIVSIAVIATLMRRIWRSELDPATTELGDVYGALTTVLDVGPRFLGGLSLPEVGDILLGEMTQRWDASAGVVLVERSGAFVESASTGLLPHGPVVVEATDPLAVALHDSTRARGVADLALPDVLRLTGPGSEPWTLMPLHHDGAPVGALLWTGRRQLTERIRLELRPVARGAGLALATARRFEQLRSISADTDRSRLREVLHGDVFENLVGLRYQLELLATRPDAAALRAEFDRLGALARDVSAHVWATADRIGSEVDARGLGAALRNHCRDLQRLTPVRLDVDLRTQQRPDRDAEVVTYELATAAIHEAVVAPGASRVGVRLLERGDAAVVVEVEHDGAGPPPGEAASGREAARAAEFGVSVEVVTAAGRMLSLITATPLSLPTEGVTS